MSIETKWFFVIGFILALFMGLRTAHAADVDAPPPVAFIASSDKFHVSFLSSSTPICNKWDEGAMVVTFVRLADRKYSWACYRMVTGGFEIASPMTGKTFTMPDNEVQPTQETLEWLSRVKNKL